MTLRIRWFVALSALLELERFAVHASFEAWCRTASATTQPCDSALATR